MASLHRLLSEEGFDSLKPRKPRKTVKFKERNGQKDSVALPIFICHDRRSFDSTCQKAEKAFSLKGSSVSSMKRGGSGSERSKERPKSEATPRRDEPAIDAAAVKATVSILSGYIGRYLKDKTFREKLKETCHSCFLEKKKQHLDSGVFAHMAQGIQSIERLIECQDRTKEMDLEMLENSIKLLNLLASMDSSLSTCAQLYLSIVYKIAKNDRISARHLLQVFINSPFLARTHLLQELWEHLFLPHLLHIKVWYNTELEFLSGPDNVETDKIARALNEQYNGLMDTGTTQFALYYIEWLKVGSQAPSLPSVPLPSNLPYARSRRRSSDISTSNHSISNRSLYKEVFGIIPKGQSVDLDHQYGKLENSWNSKAEDEVQNVGERSDVKKKLPSHRRSSNQSHRIQKTALLPESEKPDYFRFLACRAKPTEFLVHESYGGNDIRKHDSSIHLFQLSGMNRAIATICSSESLQECEMAIRAVSEVWLDTNRNLVTETSLSEASVVQGILEVLFVSNDDEVLELAISILAELAVKSEMNRTRILYSDPQLEVSMRLLRSSNLFLKAAVLLYLVKPKAEQMISVEWIPLVLRVLEFGDQLQTLFSVRCSPHEAAHYFLDQLLTGFQEDRNFENARQIISLGGLRLFVRRMEVGDTCEKQKVASLLHLCIKTDGSCRHYLAKNLKIETIISLFIPGEYANVYQHALALLTELLCLSRTKQRMEILTGLMKGWDCLNTMHILLFYLQRARPEERPIIAVILLQLDLMGDPSKCSIYREEAIDALVRALDCQVLNVKVQEQSARALLVLGGYFSYTGEPEIDKWLLRKAGFDENMDKFLCRKGISPDGYYRLNEDDKIRENWNTRAAKVLLTCGKGRLLEALSDSIANSIPSLARASLLTVCWMSNVFSSVEDKHLQLRACSYLVPQLTESLDYSKVIEERIIASLTLLGLTDGTDYFSNLSWLEKDVHGYLQELSQVTWTAKKLSSLITGS